MGQIIVGCGCGDRFGSYLMEPILTMTRSCPASFGFLCARGVKEKTTCIATPHPGPQHSTFHIPHSTFHIPHSTFHIPNSAFKPLPIQPNAFATAFAIASAFEWFVAGLDGKFTGRLFDLWWFLFAWFRLWRSKASLMRK